MSWIGAGVLLIIAGVVVYVAVNPQIGLIVGLIGAACLLVALVKSL